MARRLLSCSRVRPIHLALVLALNSCGGYSHISPLLVPSGAQAGVAVPSTPLSLVRVPRSAEPLIVRGSDEAYGDAEAALALAVSRAMASWAEGRQKSDWTRRGGFALLVEITGIDAEVTSRSRMTVDMNVRATLRARRGNVFLGQTQAGVAKGGPPVSTTVDPSFCGASTA